VIVLGGFQRVRAGADLRVTGDDGPIPGAWTGGDNAAVPDLSGHLYRPRPATVPRLSW
jgi:hypothetical protein